MSHWVYVTGTEAYYENVPDAEEHVASVTRQIHRWWDDLFGESERNPSFAYFREEGIPEDELRRTSLRDRLHDASDWTWDRRFSDGFFGSLQILDWVDESGSEWPLGTAYLDTAMTNSSRQAGITNVRAFQNVGYYFSEVGEFGTVFHELLHTYGALHWHGSVSTSDRATFILPATYGETDDNCLWFGESDVRSDFISPCTLQVVLGHIREHRHRVPTAQS